MHHLFSFLPAVCIPCSGKRNTTRRQPMTAASNPRSRLNIPIVTSAVIISRSSHMQQASPITSGTSAHANDEGADDAADDDAGGGGGMHTASVTPDSRSLSRLHLKGETRQTGRRAGRIYPVFAARMTQSSS